MEEHFDAVIDTVLDTVLDTVPSAAGLPSEERGVDASVVGLVLAQDVRAAIPLPPFSNSAMDGFLVHAASIDNGQGPWTLPVAGDVPAGGSPREVPVGQAVRIMTGGPVPEEHADLCVVPVELTTTPAGPQPLPQEVTITQAPHRRNIRARSEHICQGEIIARAGELIDAGTLAALLSAGVNRVSVYPRPRVGVISTGAELGEGVGAEGASPSTATPRTATTAQRAGTRIPDSNGPMLSALARQAGAEVVTTRRSGDHAEELAAVLDELAGQCDLIVTTGGVSAGAFDVVHDTLGHTPGAWFGHVAHKPGAPQGYGSWEGTPVLCLPGNPVAAFMSFHLYVSQALRVLAGHPRPGSPWQRPYLPAAIDAASFPAAAPAKTTLVPVQLDSHGERPVATPFSHRSLGSHLVASLSGTHGFAALDAGEELADSLRVYLF